MKKLLFLIVFMSCSMHYAQQDEKISTIDFVQIINEQKEEAIYYYEHNWKVLREMALQKTYIHSYQLLEVPYSETEPFHLMLITTYLNQEQYNLREEHFTALIQERGGLNLLNSKKPAEFRKTLFSKEMVKHYN